MLCLVRHSSIFKKLFIGLFIQNRRSEYWFSNIYIYNNQKNFEQFVTYLFIFYYIFNIFCRIGVWFTFLVCSISEILNFL